MKYIDEDIEKNLYNRIMRGADGLVADTLWRVIMHRTRNPVRDLISPIRHQVREEII